MRGCVWVTLLRCIPPEKQNILMLVTRSGTEIAVQNILRLDDEMLAIRGRLAGSQDAGRLYFIPLDNLDYFGFNSMVKDEEYTALFGNLQLPPALPAPQAIAPSSHHATAPPEPEPEPTSLPNPPTRTPAPIKSAVLERFRSRSGVSSNGTGTRPTE